MRVRARGSRPSHQASGQGGVAAGVLQQVLTLIESERLGPGDKLLSERVLAERFQVGRPAIREATRALMLLGALESRRGDGTYIKSLPDLSGGWPRKIVLAETNFDMLELLEVRRMIEPRGAGLAAARATERQMREIERALAAQEACCHDYKTFVVHDRAFHHAILCAAGNRVLEELARTLAPHVLGSLEITIRTTPDLIRIVQQHRLIFEAMRAGDSELAERAMKDHLQTTGLDLVSETRR